MGLKKFVGACLVFVTVTAFAKETTGSKKKPPGSVSSEFGPIEVSKLIVMPDRTGHQDFVDAINSAKKYVHMTMYHVTDDTVVTALMNKAADKSVDVRVIVDGGSLKGGYQTVFNKMKSAGVKIVGSSSAFSLTHNKDLVIDGKTAIISAINMTNTAANTRDFGIITTDAGIISEIETVFAADLQNAQTNGDVTPPTSNPNLVWSPTTSDTLLVKLINSATTSLVMETESFNHADIISAMNAAAARGVNVRLIVPECDLGNATMNYQYLAQLKNVRVHVEHDGNSITQPYLHSKMMIADNTTMYIGSINFTFNSIAKDRELGVIFTNPTTSSELANEFETDWNRSQNPSTNPNCGAGSLGGGSKDSGNYGNGGTTGGGKKKKKKGHEGYDEGELNPWDILTY